MSKLSDYPLSTNQTNSRVAGVDGSDDVVLFSFATVTKAVSDQLASDVQALQSADTTAADNLSQEITDRTQADNTIADNLSQEITDRTQADNTIANNLSQEITDRTQAVSTVQGNLDTEAATRSNDDATLQGNIDSANTARANGDSYLQGLIDDIDGTISTIQSTLATKANSSALANYVLLSSVGAANGVAPLGSDGKIASAYIPGSYDQILEYSTRSNFPTTGQTSIMYLALDTGNIYRWSGSTYVEISPSPGSTDAVPEGSVNLYFNDARAIAALQSTLSNYLTINSASATYQTQAGMSGYLTTSSAASTYQTQSGMSSYLTTSAASSTYLTQSNAAATYQTQSGMSSYLTTSAASSTYLTQSNAAATYQTLSGMSSYLTTSAAASTYLTQTNAASTYLTQSNASSTYATQSALSSGLASKQNSLGFTPVRQGGGINQTTNTVYIGWSNDSRLKVTVDSTDLGNVVFDSNLSGYATQSYVTSQGYLTSSDLSDYATQSYVTSQGYITSSALSGYATQTFVTSQGYATQTYVDNAVAGVSLNGAVINSAATAIASGGVATFALPGDKSQTYFFFIRKGGSTDTYAYGMVANYNTSSRVLVLFASSNIDVSGSSLTGSTGTSGHATLSVQNGTQNIYVENRMETNSYRITMWG